MVAIFNPKIPDPEAWIASERIRDHAHELLALVTDFADACEYAAGCNEGCPVGEAESEILRWAGSPMAVFYDKARAAIARATGAA